MNDSNTLIKQDTEQTLNAVLATMQMFKTSLERLVAAAEAKNDTYGNRLLFEECEQLKGLIEVLTLMQAGTIGGLEHYYRERRQQGELPTTHQAIEPAQCDRIRLGE